MEEHLQDYGSINSGEQGDLLYNSDGSFEYNFDLSIDDYNEHSSFCSVVFCENTSLNESTGSSKTAHMKQYARNLRRRTDTVVSYISNITHSITKHTASNYLGFSSTSYAVARIKDQRDSAFSRTLSLDHIPSEDRNTPTLVSFFTLLSIITGLSVFAIPIVVARSGFSMLIALVGIGILTWYSSHLINKCQYQVSKKTGMQKRVYENYIDVGIASITWHGESVMKVLVGSSVLTDIYVLIFCAQITKDLTYQYFQIDDRVWMLLWMLAVFPLYFIRKMSVLAWFGFFSLIFYVIGLFMVIGLLIWHHDLWELENLNVDKAGFNISYLFIGYGIFINSFNLHLSAPAIEASMKHPGSFEKINAIAFGLNTVLKIIVAVAATALFGVATNGSMLTNMKIFGTATMVINVFVGLYMFLQYPTSLFVVLEMLDIYVLPKFKLFKQGERSEWGWMFLSRLLVTLFITFVAVSMPNFEMVTGFIGNIRGTCAILLFPIYFYLKLHKRYISTASYVFHCVVMLSATCIGLTGATFSVLGMLGYNDLVI